MSAFLQRLITGLNYLSRFTWQTEFIILEHYLFRCTLFSEVIFLYVICNHKKGFFKTLQNTYANTTETNKYHTPKSTYPAGKTRKFWFLKLKKKKKIMFLRVGNKDFLTDLNQWLRKCFIKSIIVENSLNCFRWGHILYY